MKKLLPYIYILGAIACLIGISLKITDWHYAPYLVTIGGTLMALAHLNDPYAGSNLTVKRLYRQQFLANILLIATGGTMLYFPGTEWIMLATVAAVLYLYSTFRLLHEHNKEQSN